MKSQMQTTSRNDWNCGTGRRKTSTARVYIRPGPSSKVIVNGRPLKSYFERKVHQKVVRQPVWEVCPLPLVVKVNVMGGGKSGQADAIRLGLARALVSFGPSFRSRLAKQKLLTRDPRTVERKKVGLCKARKGKQFSKR